MGELTHRGYYLGSNVSYNVNKMVENDYLIQARSSHNRRSVRLRGSEKGLALVEKIAEMYAKYEMALKDTTITAENL